MHSAGIPLVKSSGHRGCTDSNFAVWLILDPYLLNVGLEYSDPHPTSSPVHVREWTLFIPGERSEDNWEGVLKKYGVMERGSEKNGIL